MPDTTQRLLDLNFVKTHCRIASAAAIRRFVMQADVGDITTLYRFVLCENRKRLVR